MVTALFGDVDGVAYDTPLNGILSLTKLETCMQWASFAGPVPHGNLGGCRVPPGFGVGALGAHGGAGPSW